MNGGEKTVTGGDLHGQLRDLDSVNRAVVRLPPQWAPTLASTPPPVARPQLAARRRFCRLARSMVRAGLSGKHSPGVVPGLLCQPGVAVRLRTVIVLGAERQ